MGTSYRGEQVARHPEEVGEWVAIQATGVKERAWIMDQFLERGGRVGGAMESGRCHETHLEGVGRRQRVGVG